MKRFVFAIVVAVFSLNLTAKEISKNVWTGSSLHNNSGLWSIHTSAGNLQLGDITEARNFLMSADLCFAKKNLKMFNIGKDNYVLDEDSDGVFVHKIGQYQVKIRPSDATKYLGVLECGIIKDKAKKIWNIIKE